MVPFSSISGNSGARAGERCRNHESYESNESWTRVEERGFTTKYTEYTKLGLWAWIFKLKQLFVSCISCISWLKFFPQTRFLSIRRIREIRGSFLFYFRKFGVLEFGPLTLGKERFEPQMDGMDADEEDLSIGAATL